MSHSAALARSSVELSAAPSPRRDMIIALQRELFACVAADESPQRLLARVGERFEVLLEQSQCRLVEVSSAGAIIERRDAPQWPLVDAAMATGDDPLVAAALAGAPTTIADLQNDARWPAHGACALLGRMKSCVVEPFAVDDECRGAVALYFPAQSPHGAEGAQLLAAMAADIGVALRACRANARVRTDATRFQSLSKSIPGVVYQRLVTPTGDIRYTYISESAEELFGVDAETIVSDPEALFRHYDADYRESFRAKLIEASRAMTTWDVEAKIRRPDGQVRFTHAIARPSRLDDGSVLWTGVILNADRIKKAELAAAEAEAKTREAIVESLSQGIVLFDKDDKLVVANNYFRTLYPVLAPYTKAGISYADFIQAEQTMLPIARRETDHLSASRRQGDRDSGGYVAERRIGEERWIMVTENRTADGGTVILHTDVSELKLRENRIHHLAYHDVLTGLPNRASFRQKLTEDLARSRKVSESLAVLCLDLDGFKYVNDTLGHPAGDELLVEVARRISENIRDTDTAARLGGDEFAIVVSENVTVEAVTGIAWRLLNALAEPVDIRGQQVITTTSIGVAFASGTEENDPDYLMKNADLALYRSKSDGRNTFRFFEAEMDALAQQRRILENDLRLAVEREELELYFQPLVDVYTEEVMGAEALVRWRHPTRGLISPTDFIALAEETGIIVKIGAWVLRRACLEAAEWPSAIRVAVNLSPAQFRDRELLQNVKKVLTETGLDPSRLELEVTESLLLRDTAANLQTLNDIKALGVRISMDDFGTGYSSLGNLRSFPFDKIKIDRSFVRDLESSPDSAAIIRAVLSLGRGLGMTTTAEGVETRDQLAYLRAEGCSEVQGFYFSEPRPANEMAAMIRDGFPRVALQPKRDD